MPIYWIYEDSKDEFDFMFTLHRKIALLARVHLYNFFSTALNFFLNLLYSDVPNFLLSIQISSNEAVGNYVQSTLAMASEVFSLVIFLLVLLLQPWKVCLQTKGNNVDIYLNSHTCVA